MTKQEGPISLVENIEKKKEEFSWSDLEFIEKKNLGLRHLSTQEEMEGEIKDGFEGDTLAISNVRNLVNDYCSPENLEISEGINIKPSIEIVGKFLDDPYRRDILIGYFKKAVSSFIKDSIRYAPLIHREENVGETLDFLKGKHSFLIVKNDGPTGYDENNYYGLGKSGKREYKPEEVLGSISAEEIISELNVSENNLGRPMGSAFGEYVMYTIYKLLIKKITDLTNKEVSIKP